MTAIEEIPDSPVLAPSGYSSLLLIQHGEVLTVQPEPFDFGDKAAYAQGERCLYIFVPDQ